MLVHLKDADSHVTHEGKLNKLLDVVAAQRHKQPDARVAYHTLKDSPQPGRPSWFALNLKFQVYFRTENVPSKAAEDNETTPKVARGHLAGCSRSRHTQAEIPQKRGRFSAEAGGEVKIIEL